MPWVIGLAVAYVGWKFYEASKNPGNNFWNEEAKLNLPVQGQVKYPDGGSGYNAYWQIQPGNVVL